MSKMISSSNVFINRKVDCLNYQGIIHRWNTYKFYYVKISAKRNQPLQYCITAFYNDIGEI